MRSVTSEDDDRSSQHLEATGVGEGEADILETCGRHITESGGQKYQGIELLGSICIIEVRVAVSLLPTSSPSRKPEGKHAEHLSQEHS